MKQQQICSYALKEASLLLLGAWTKNNAAVIEHQLGQLTYAQLSHITVVDVADLEDIDTFGLWMLQSAFYQQQLDFPQIINGQAQVEQLWYKLAELHNDPPEAPAQPSFMYGFFIRIGIIFQNIYAGLYDVFAFHGRLFLTFLRLCMNPQRIRMGSVSAQIFQVGVQAVGIITLIAFSIAIVVGLLGLIQLQMYGVEELTINLVAFGILREMGVLLTAIMVAGRTGSAYAAELGLMNVNEETDALETMGLDVFEVLVTPRMIAVIVSMILLTVIADVVGLLADLCIATFVLNQTPRAFFATIIQLPLLEYFLVGLVRAPVYGLMIGATACRLGLQVKGSAQELGRNTTNSVVQSIFIVIILHACFALFFQMLGI